MIETAGTGRFGAEADLDRAIDELALRDPLPVAPFAGVAFRIAELVRAGDFGLPEIGKLFRADAALAADLLRAARAVQHGREAVVSIDAALARAGEPWLAQAARAVAAGADAHAQDPLASLRRTAWQDALGSAVLSRVLARERGLDPEEAFACGLLHDVGRIAVIGAIERIAAGSRAMPARCWEAVVERHHVRVGAILAERWGLPRLVRDAIRLHHEDATEGAASPALLEVVKVVDSAVRLLAERAGAAPEDLAAISVLSDRETSAVSRALRVLPEYLGSLDRAPERPRAGDEARAAPPRARAGAGVHVRIGGSRWTALGVGPHQLAVRGGASLPEGGMVEVEALDGRRVGFHARVLLTWPEGSGFGALLMPFGLSGPALLDWRGLVPASASA